MRWTIRLLGLPAITDDRGKAREVRGHQAWAVLARVLLSSAPLARRALASELFPDTADPLGSLRWCLAALRKAFDSPDCLRGDPIEAHLGGGAEIDVWRLDDDAFDIAEAGPLLEGVDPRSSPEFATWLLIERQRIASHVEGRLRRDILSALSAGHHARAIGLAELGARRNPLDEAAHVLLVKALVLAGDADTALQHVEATERVFMDELGVRPSAALRSAARRTIASAPGGVSPAVFANSLIQSGLSALSAGAVDAGIDCLRRAAGDAEKIGDRHLQARAWLELGTALVHAVRGYDDEGSVLLRQAAMLAKGAGYGDIATTGFRELGYVDALAGRRPSAAQYLEKARETAEGDAAFAGINAVAGFNLFDWGHADDGIAAFREALGQARACGNRRWEIWCLGIGARALLGIQRDAEAEAWLLRCLERVDETGWMSFRPWPVAVLGECRVRRREATAAIRARLEESYALSCQLADPCWEGAVARVIALCSAADGDFTSAAAWLDDGAKRCRRETDVFAGLQVEILAEQAAMSRRLGQETKAQAFAHDWVSLAARTHMNGHIQRAANFLAGRGAVAAPKPGRG